MDHPPFHPPLHPSRPGPAAPVLAVILARAGSKGVPGKNAAMVAGKPCVRWTIDAALASRTVALTALSTDVDDIARAAPAQVAVVRRPAALADDTATVDAAARHAVGAIAEARPEAARWLSEPATPIVILYGNVPVRPPDLIDRAVRRLIETGCDSVQSYAPVGKHHPWWTARLDEGTGRVEPWEGEVLNHGIHRRQDLAPAFVPDGGVVVVTRRALFLRIPGVAPGPHAFFGLDRRGVVTGVGSVIDIDAPIDLVVAEAILGGRADGGGTS